MLMTWPSQIFEKSFFPVENTGNMPEIAVFVDFHRTISLSFVVFSRKNISDIAFLFVRSFVRSFFRSRARLRSFVLSLSGRSNQHSGLLFLKIIDILRCILTFILKFYQVNSHTFSHLHPKNGTVSRNLCGRNN